MTMMMFFCHITSQMMNTSEYIQICSVSLRIYPNMAKYNDLPRLRWRSGSRTGEWSGGTAKSENCWLRWADGPVLPCHIDIFSLSSVSPSSLSSSPQSSQGGNREQTLPTKSNPNPDLTDAGEAENRWNGDFHDEDDHHDDSDDDGDHHDDDSDKDDDDAECEDGLIETCEKVPHVNVSISCREGEEEQDNHKQGDFTPISGEFRFQKLVRSHNCHHVDRDSISIVIQRCLMF